MIEGGRHNEYFELLPFILDIIRCHGQSVEHTFEGAQMTDRKPRYKQDRSGNGWNQRLIGLVQLSVNESLKNMS